MARLKRLWPWAAVSSGKSGVANLADVEMTETKPRILPPYGPLVQDRTFLKENPTHDTVTFRHQVKGINVKRAYRLTIGGESVANSRIFLKTLIEVLRQPNEYSFREAVMRAFGDRYPFVKVRGLRRIAGSEYELYDVDLSNLNAWDHQSTIQATVKRSLTTAAPLNFSYRTPGSEAAVRRVNVTAVHPEYFVGRSRRGVRSYRFDRTLKSFAEGDSQRAVELEPQITIILKPGGEAKALLEFGDKSPEAEYLRNSHRLKELQRKLQQDLLEIDSKLAQLDRLTRENR